MREKNKRKKEKRRYPTAVSVDRNGAASWGDKGRELSDSSTPSTLSAATDDEDRLTINELAEGQTNNLMRHSLPHIPPMLIQQTQTNKPMRDKTPHKLPLLLTIHQLLQQRKHTRLRLTRSQQMRQK